ncbi:MAG: Holliday junction resolvase RuvX [Bacteroidetes bacterium]|nr:Holliday junction resolvase RuvX [Bacteroidota bacterium]MBK9412533.1 Holliday junction resolvase RuvX [Bacteroidota bacterium]MBL0032156.1 Holliday junction resolvase RuvX [Bacteroidota bacterium]MBP6427006.1 Holliday junction resolvase RuvX [Bacteroidia bacterium]MBP6656380.1 Holliday junction resolvase RuvX [Bacteroidia bacterium]
MGRIMAIDYGTKRVGIAVTDPNKIIATALDTVHSKDIIEYLKKYFIAQEVELVVIGEPRQMDNTASEVTPQVEQFVKAIKKAFPEMSIARFDERFTSKMAEQAIRMSGIKKMERRNKSLVDQTSAVIILQSYMNANQI